MHKNSIVLTVLVVPRIHFFLVLLGTATNHYLRFHTNDTDKHKKTLLKAVLTSALSKILV